MRRKKIILYTLAVLLLGGIAAAIYGYKEYNRKAEDAATVKVQFTSSAVDLLTEFAANETTANTKYAGKVLEVSGVIKEINNSETGSCTVVLGDTASLSSVRCAIDSAYNQDAKKFAKGNTVTVKGICSGYNADEMLGSDLILVRSFVQKNK